MADLDTLTTEELDLRRRARRRLVGAIALALLAVVILPMLFNPEPKPLGPEVDIRIPDQGTPFEPRQPAVPTPAHQPQTDVTALGQERVVAPPYNPAPAVSPAPSIAPPVSPPRQTPLTAETDARATTSQQVPPAGTVGNTPSAATAKPPAPATESFAARGYFLQLGAFTSKDNARQLADRAQAAGFNVVVQEVGGQVRVRMGPYAERKQALEIQAKLRAKGFGPILLGP